MLVTADIGNTHIVFGLWIQGELKDVCRFSTSIQRTSHEWRFLIKSWLNPFTEQANDTDIADKSIIYSSVVPAADAQIEEAFDWLDFKNIICLNLSLELPIKFDYPNPGSLGADRIANSIAGIHFYGDDLLIVDFGTAITFCVITSSVYRGGVIAPGMKAGLDFLASKTAKLPRLSLTRASNKISSEKDVSVLGKSTEESILAGARFGWEGMITHIVENLRTEVLNQKLIKDAEDLQIIATGGVTNHLLLNDQLFDIIDANLTLRGLREVFLFQNAPISKK